MDLTGSNSKNTKKENKQLRDIIKDKDFIIDDLTDELLEFQGFKKGLIWRSLNLYRVLKKAPKRVVKSIKNKGFVYTLKKIISLRLRYNRINFFDTEAYNTSYQKWLHNNDFLSQDIKYKDTNFKYKPLISIIMPVYNVETKYLEKAIESVSSQIYPNWELCIADDASTDPNIKIILEKYKKKDKRIKIAYRKENGHISACSNSALELAKGEYIALLDNDDIMYPHALYKVVEALNKNKELDFIYSDEDKLELDSTRTHPFFKPDWSPDLFLSSNYLCHLSVIRKTLVDKVKGFRIGFEGSQDYDLFLRVTELTNKIYHIPDILYSWRKIPGSTAAAYDVKGYANEASIKALQDHLKRMDIKGHVFNGIMPGTFRIKYAIKNNPLVSIIIPTKDKINYLKKCINSIDDKTEYKNYEIIIINNKSEKEQSISYLETIKQNKKINVYDWNQEFNFSEINNFASRKAKGNYLLFLNNDTEIISPDWIESMLMFAQNERVGAVGSKLIFSNNTIQHAGIVLGLGDDLIGSHIYFGSDDTPRGLPIRKDVICNYSAVTGACMMVRKKYFKEVKGFEEKLSVCYNDIDLCLKLREKGYFIVYTPFTKLYHFESITRRNRKTKKTQIQKQEVNYMRDKWGNILLSDPYYNPNLSLDVSGYKVRT